MAKVIIGNASAITVRRQDRDDIRRFYCDVLGGKIVKEDNEKDIFRLEEEFYILFRYGDVPDESEFLRSPRALWLQIKTDNVEELTRKILDFGARKIDLPSGQTESVPILIFRCLGDNASNCSQSTRTSPITREAETAQISQRKKRPRPSRRKR